MARPSPSTSVFVFLLAILIMLWPDANAQPSGGAVFREYIGGGGAALTDVPVNKSVEFHFILAFAVDEPPNGSSSSSTNGNFSAFWQPRLSASSVKSIKNANSNVKVMMSLGGGGTIQIFNPTSVSSWVSNAVTSITPIVREYGLDGIDVDYEDFVDMSTADFASCIGQLITQLKQAGVISIASIAPYPVTDSFYTELWKQYSGVIDYVNYQFYSQGDMSVTEYVSSYNQTASMYAGGKVLASFETLNNGSSIVPSSGLEACQQLKQSGLLSGIFIWSADQSYPNFQYEQQAQSLLAA